MAQSRAGVRSSQTPPPSTRSGFHAAFSASLEEPIRSSMTMTSLLRETETHTYIYIYFGLLRVLVGPWRGAR